MVGLSLLLTSTPAWAYSETTMRAGVTLLCSHHCRPSGLECSRKSGSPPSPSPGPCEASQRRKHSSWSEYGVCAALALVSMETTHAASEGGSAWSGEAAREGAGASIGVPRATEGLPRAPDKRGELGEPQYVLSPRHSCIPELVLTSRQVVGEHTRC